MKKLTDEEDQAMQNAMPKPPQVYELGGDYYYRCYWISCNEVLKKWWNYCPNCGQKIEWSKR